MPTGYGYDATFSNGGANMLLNSRFGGGGGDGSGGGAGGGLNAQLNAMSNFDPSVWMNPLLQNQRDLFRFGLERKDFERNRAKKEGEASTRRASMQMGKEPSGPTGAMAMGQNPQIQAFNQARNYMDRMETPLDRYTMGNSPLGSNFRNFPGASMLSGVGGGFPNEWIDLYKASAQQQPDRRGQADVLGAQTQAMQQADNARQLQIMQQYPGLAARMFPQPQGKG